ncbi:MAG: DUF1080 domain-containing protein [Bacteroidota bacterium]
MKNVLVNFLLAGIGLLLLSPILHAQEKQTKPKPEFTEQWEPVPAVIDPGNSQKAPSDAIVLFDGTNLEAWQHPSGDAPKWSVEDGAFTVERGTGMIRTKQGFGDIQLHLEWRAPSEVVGKSQGRGNSGVFLMGMYEVQVLDNYDNITYPNGQAASIYKQHIPLVNACRPPGEWQTYDIIFTAPVFGEGGAMKHPAYVTVIHNGVLVQNHVALLGPTEYIGIPRYKEHEGKLPITLQDHGNPVSFRNIWVREL